MIYILHQQDRVPIRIRSKKSCLRRIFLHEFACSVFFSQKNLFPIIKSRPWAIWFQCLVWFTNLLVVEMIWIQILSDHNDPICKRKHWKKCELTKHSSEQTSWDTNRTTPIQFPNSIQERSYVITRNINITRLWASTSRRIKRSSGWYRW